MLLLAAAFVSYYAVLVYCDLARPEPAGFTSIVDSTGMRLTEVVAGSPAAGAGLRAGDRIVAAHGRPVRGRLDWIAVQTNLRTNVPLQLGVRRGQMNVDGVLVLRRAAASFWTSSAGATVLLARFTQLVTLAVALLVGFKRPGDRGARLASWLMATLATYSIALPYQIAAIWRSLPPPIGLVLWIPYASGLCIAAILFTFFASFPQPVLRTRTRILAWAPMLATLVLQLGFTISVVYDPGRTTPFADWTLVTIAVTVAYAVAAAAVLVVAYRRLTDVSDRRRIRVMSAGSAVGLVSGLVIVSAYWGRGGASIESSVFSSPLLAGGTVLGLALPASLSYAVLRHRLFDVGYILRRGIQHALARHVLVSIAPLAAAAFVADLAWHRTVAIDSVVLERGWLYASLSAIAVVARVRRDDWLDGLDRRFFRERYNAQRLLRMMTEDIRGLPDLAAAGPGVMSKIANAIHPEYIVVMAHDAGEPAFRTSSAVPPDRIVAPLDAGSPLVGLLRVLQRPVQVGTGGSILKQLPETDSTWLAENHVDLIVPVATGAGGAESLFALGPKRSEEPYGAEDEDLLAAIGAALSLILRRAEVTDGAVVGGRYRLERPVGQGGMGTVYVAYDTALDRRVAVKVLRQDLIDPDAAERFQREARLAAALAHPNVVTVHDIGVTPSGHAFLVMELLEGVTLRQELQRLTRLPVPRVRDILCGVCAAVDAAHRRQMVHRDLKPENVFLCRGESGEIPKVLDFGLAKALGPDGVATLTRPGMVAGTPQYMAPEHLQGDEPSPDWDLWSLAVVAFEMITGRFPFDGPNATAPRLDELPEQLRPVFATALSRNPINRPASAQELFVLLEKAGMNDGPSI